MLAGIDFLLSAVLVPDDVMAGDQFGKSVDLDGSTVVAGAPGVDQAEGAVYVYEPEAGTWTEQARLTLDAGTPDDLFGFSVAISGDTIVVGAPQRSGDRSGAAYVFERDHDSWLYEATLLPTSDHAVRDFGASLAIEGNTILVGAPATDDGHGSVFAFRDDGTAWTQEAELFVPDIPLFDILDVGGFGTSIDLDGDMAVVGAPFEERSSIPWGAGYIYQHDEGTWQLKAKLDDARQMGLGSGVAIDGDTIVVRSYIFGGADGRFDTSVYRGSGAVWEQQVEIENSSHPPTSENAAIDRNLFVVGNAVYEWNGTKWFLGDILQVNGTVESVAIHGTAIVTGTPFDVGGGAVRVFSDGATVTGRVWEDANRDGRRDETEGLVDGVTVRVLNGAMQVVASQNTIDGTYSIRLPVSGMYTVEIEPPPTTNFSPPDQGDDLADSDVDPLTGRSVPFTLSIGATATYDAGLFGTSVGESIEGRAWFDLNENGIREDGEAPMGNIPVTLIDRSSVTVAQTTTATDGTYAFSPVDPGTYRVAFDPPIGFGFSDANQGSVETVDSDVLPAGTSGLFTVLTGQRITALDAGLVGVIDQLSGFVWDDVNRDGIRDANEAGVEGITVQLLDDALSVVQTATTRGNGRYSMSVKAAADYAVRFIAPSGTAFSPRNQGDDPLRDSDPDPVSGRTDSFFFAFGEGKRHDAGLYGTSDETGIEGLAWFDLNGNGIREDGELPMANVPVILLDVASTPIAETVTATDGTYTFSEINPGSYRVAFDPPTGFSFSPADQGTDDTIDSDVLSGGTTDLATLTFVTGQRMASLDAGLTVADTLGGFVWDDVDRDGIREEGEAGVAGVTVRLLDEQLLVVETTITDSAGAYQFRTQPEGVYLVEFMAPAGTLFSPSGQGDNFLMDSDADPVTGRTDSFTLPAGRGRRIDAGLHGTAASTRISGLAWDDDGDGVRDPATEESLADIQVHLLGADLSPVASTTTGADGSYQFDGIDPGVYTIRVDVPAGATLTPMNRGGDDAVDSDLNRSTGQTPFFSLLANQHATPADAGIYSGPLSDHTQDFLRITELMFDGRADFVELKNIGPEPLDLTGVRFIDGIAFDFSFGNLTSLFPDEYVVIVENSPEQFAQLYDVSEMNIAGQYAGYLDNQGERIELVAPINREILTFTYSPKWFPLGKSRGYTVRDERTITELWDRQLGWRPGSRELGTPGEADPFEMPEPGAIVINEIMTNPADGFNDWIELYNTTDAPIDIGGWFLGDADLDGDNRYLDRYRIADGTVVPAGGYVTFTRAEHFGNPDDPGARMPFGLSSFGEVVYLVGGDARGLRPDYVASARFGAAPTDVSFGRHLVDQRSTFFASSPVLDEPVHIGPNERLATPFEPAWLPGELVHLNVRDISTGHGFSVALVSPSGTRVSLIDSNVDQSGFRETVYNFPGFEGENRNGIWLLEVMTGAEGIDLVASFLQMTTDVKTADFVAMAEPTMGAGNSVPRVGPVVINELMYHQAFLADEFVELHNISGEDVDLSSWWINGVGNVSIPTGTVLPADGYLLVVPTEPDAFRQKWDIPAEVPIVGPYAGQLDNGGESVSLYRVEVDNRGRQLSVLTDRVVYDNKFPWPSEADQGGGSLERILPFRYGNDVESWAVTRVPNGTPGARNSVTSSVVPGDMDLNGRVDMDDIDDFVLALEDPIDYGLLHGVAPEFIGDTDGDRDFDFDDIAGFAAGLNGDPAAGAAATPTVWAPLAARPAVQDQSVRMAVLGQSRQPAEAATAAGQVRPVAVPRSAASRQHTSKHAGNRRAQDPTAGHALRKRAAVWSEDTDWLGRLA